MKKIFNKFLIVVVIVIFTGGVYLSYSNDLVSGPFVKVANASSLSSSTGFISSALSSLSSSDKISSDIAFLTTLTSLKKITIDTSLFSDKSFISLRNNSVKIDPVIPGRSNPFSPIGVNNKTTSTVSTPKVITDQPTGLTDKSVVFNGTINVANDTANTYFEYGTTKNLGTVTPIIQPSLVGTFIKNVLGLTPKTDYFYRACAKINNIANCGEVVLFTTN
jgi:hypothetical protein